MTRSRSSPNRFYLYLAPYVDIHATDVAEQATVTRVDDGSVEVQLRSSDGTRPPIPRRFDRERNPRDPRLPPRRERHRRRRRRCPRTAFRCGSSAANGTNTCVDSSLVGGSARRTHLYDLGTVTGISYGPDTLYDRRPWVKEDRQVRAARPRLRRRAPPGRGPSPTATSVSSSASARTACAMASGSGRTPAGSASKLEYSTGVDGFRVAALRPTGDANRLPLHVTALAPVSMLEVINFFGFGNDTPGDPGAFYEARQRQWLLQPAIALDVGVARSACPSGPCSSTRPSTASPAASSPRADPYGFGDFGQVGLRVGLSSRHAAAGQEPESWLACRRERQLLPGDLGRAGPFGRSPRMPPRTVTLPVPVHPILVLRAGGRKVFGEYPLNEAAFIGGMATVRTLVLQRYAGDAPSTAPPSCASRWPGFPWSCRSTWACSASWTPAGSSSTANHPAAGTPPPAPGSGSAILEPSTGVSIAWTNTSGDTAVLIRARLAF